MSISINFKAITADINPINNEPVSPINIFAGVILNLKKPMIAPTIASETAANSYCLIYINNAANVPLVIIPVVAASPSIPSIKLKALTTNKMIKIDNAVLNK